MSRPKRPTPEQVIKSVNDDIDKVFENIEDHVVGIAGEDIPEYVADVPKPDEPIMDTELSSVEPKIFGTFQLTCNELGECETRKVMIKFPVPAFNRCLRCNKLGVKIVS